MIAKLTGLNPSRKILVAVLLLACVIRLSGLSYGLPLWLVDDEPPFVLAAIKMIELHTIVPAFHQAAFEKVLYYPPYLSYLFILPFSAILGFQYLLHHSLGDLFIPYIVSDLSPFFITARLIIMFISLISIFLIFRIGKNLFSDERIGAIAAFFLATSLLHILVSITARHWLAVSFFGLLIFYILTEPTYKKRRKYLLAIAATGVGMGFSTIVIVYLALIGLWYLLEEKERLLKRDILSCIALFAALAAIPLLLYPQSLGFRGDVSVHAAKTIGGLIASPFLFLKPIALSDPILMLCALIGLITLFYRRRTLCVFFLTFLYSYSILFYVAFRYEHRFTAGILPLLALLAAYGMYTAAKLANKQAVYALLIIPLIFSLQLTWLLSRNDSRINARDWIEQHIPPHEKILVYARLTRLSSNPAAIEEQRTIDEGSLRKVDEAEEMFTENPHGTPSFHALNLYSVNNPSFFDALPKYAAENKYTYLLISDEDFMRGEDEFNSMHAFAKSGSLIKTFGSYQPNYSVSIMQLLGAPLALFTFDAFGPPLSLYRISQQTTTKE